VVFESHNRESDRGAVPEPARGFNPSEVALRWSITIVACLVTLAVPDLAQAQNAPTHTAPTHTAPTHVASLYRQGITAVQGGDLAGARTAFEQVVKLAPGSPEGHNSLGWVLFSQGHLAEAISQFRTALRLKPNFLQAHINLANALAQSGNLPEADSGAREAVRLAP